MKNPVALLLFLCGATPPTMGQNTPQHPTKLLSAKYTSLEYTPDLTPSSSANPQHEYVRPPQYPQLKPQYPQQQQQFQAQRAKSQQQQQQQQVYKVQQQRQPVRQRPEDPLTSSEERELEEEDKPDRLQELLLSSKFTCGGKKDGYYADDGLNCEVFHYCQDGAKHSWLCPEKFAFHQIHLICVPPSSDNLCASSPDYHFVNDYLYKPVNQKEATAYNETLRYADRFFPQSYGGTELIPAASPGRYYAESEEEEEEEAPPRPSHSRGTSAPRPPQSQYYPQRFSPPKARPQQHYPQGIQQQQQRAQASTQSLQGQAYFDHRQINIPLAKRRPFILGPPQPHPQLQPTTNK